MSSNNIVLTRINLVMSTTSLLVEYRAHQRPAMHVMQISGTIDQGSWSGVIFTKRE